MQHLIWHQTLFYVLLAVAVGYSLRRGGAPERMVAAVLLFGTVATWLVAIGPSGSRAGHGRSVMDAVALVDCVMLVGLLGIALFADRFWPLWLTALQAFGVVGHVAKWIGGPDILPHVYKMAHAFSAYPGLMLLIAATFWHQRRLRHSGTDPAWSTFLLPSTLVALKRRPSTF